MKKYEQKELNKLNRAQLVELLSANEVEFDEKMSNAELKDLLLEIEGEEDPEVPEEATTVDPDTEKVQNPASDAINAAIAARRAKVGGATGNTMQEEVERRRRKYSAN